MSKNTCVGRVRGGGGSGCSHNAASEGQRCAAVLIQLITMRPGASPRSRHTLWVTTAFFLACFVAACALIRPQDRHSSTAATAANARQLCAMVPVCVCVRGRMSWWMKGNCEATCGYGLGCLCSKAARCPHCLLTDHHTLTHTRDLRHIAAHTKLLRSPASWPHPPPLPPAICWWLWCLSCLTTNPGQITQHTNARKHARTSQQPWQRRPRRA
jgi:hypothetical protein